jgi:hydroxypyruvate reductase
MPTHLDPASPLYGEMRRRVREMFDHALAECNIPTAMRRHIELQEKNLRVGNQLYDLDGFSVVKVVSIGKAGHSLAQALAEITNGGLHGIISCPSPPAAQVFGFRYFLGGHPLPNEDSLRAGEAILKLLANSGLETLCLYLISGGASAIAEKPISPAISLDDVIATYKALVHSGAPISEINAVRKHLSAVKGGRMARAAIPAHQLSILVSDVPENSFDALASGPTMPDTTTVDDCYTIAKKYHLMPEFPANVRGMFERKELEETPKESDLAFSRSRYLTVLSNSTAIKAAVENAALAGFAVEVDTTCDDWDYADAADHLLSRVRELRRGASRVCLISGGEVTVRAGKNPGIGGRNQQFALHCAHKIQGQPITVLSAGTDGIDGNSQGAGAISDGSTVSRAQEKGLNAGEALKSLNAFPLFDALGDAIITGPTGNNVRDLRVLLAY